MARHHKPDYSGIWRILDKIGLARPCLEVLATLTWIYKQRESKVNWPHIYLNWGWIAWERRQWFSDFVMDSVLLQHARFVFLGTMGARWRAMIPLGRPKVFVTQEDTTTRFRQYDDYLVGSVDLSLGFKPDIEKQHILHFPIWMQWYMYPSTRFDDLPVQENGPWTPAQFVADISCWDGSDKRDLFCALVASHDDRGNGKGLRSMCLEMMEKEGYVACAGKLHNNTDVLHKAYDNHIVPFLRTARFNICFENVSSPGYTTEKLFQAWLAGSIPVYWGGDEHPEKEYLTGNGIIFFDPNNPSRAFQLVKRLNRDADFRKEWMLRPKFHHDAVSKLEARLKKLEEELARISRRK